MKYLVLCFLLCVGCSSNIPNPPKAIPVKPLVEQIQKPVEAASVTVARIKNDVAALEVQLAEARAAGNSAATIAEHADKVTEELRNDVAKLNKELSKEQKASANAKTYKHWIFGLVITFVLWVIVKNVLLFYFPATKFRI